MTTKSTSHKTLAELNETYQKLEAQKTKSKQHQAIQIASRYVDRVAWKADRRMTSYPLFAPDKRNRCDIFEYTSPDGHYKITVLPHPKLGRAKVWDADVFNYFLSRAYEAYQKTQQIPRTIETSAYRVLKALGKEPKTGKNHAWLHDAIRRLNATIYQANIFMGVGRGEKGFNLLNYDFEEKNIKGQRMIDKIIIQFNSELIECWLNDIKHILALPNGVLEECLKEQRSGLRKRLLLLIGTRLGHQGSIVVSLENFRGLCGYTGENRRFKAALKEITPSLPWHLEFSKQAGSKKENVIISQKAALIA